MIEAQQLVALHVVVADYFLLYVPKELAEELPLQLHQMQPASGLCFVHYPYGMSCQVVVHDFASGMGGQMVVLVSEILLGQLALVLETLVQRFGMAPGQSLVVGDMAEGLPEMMPGTFGQGSGMSDQRLMLVLGTFGLPVEMAFASVQFDQEVILYLEEVALDLKMEPAQFWKQ